jgi:hypothetical protein
MTQGFSSFTFRDYGNEVSTVRVRSATRTAANFDAVATAFGTLNTAMVAMTRNTAVSAYAYGNDQLNSVLGAAVDESQREQKWRVDYHETADPTKTGFFTVPCANTDLLDATDREHADPADADVIAFIAAVEAHVLSQDGAAITVDQITLTHRRS